MTLSAHKILDEALQEFGRVWQAAMCSVLISFSASFREEIFPDQKSKAKNRQRQRPNNQTEGPFGQFKPKPIWNCLAPYDNHQEHDPHPRNTVSKPCKSLLFFDVVFKVLICKQFPSDIGVLPHFGVIDLRLGVCELFLLPRRGFI